MKIKITYKDEEELQKLFLKPLGELIAEGAKVKKPSKNAPYLHCYIELSQDSAKCSDKEKS